MAEINVNEYIRTADGKIGKFDRYSSMPNTSIYKSPFNCFIKLQGRKTPLQCHRDYIANHSKNIIDLIEVGDYVNGYKVSRKDTGVIVVFDYFGFARGIKIEEVKSIVTKEQFASMEIQIGGIKK